MKVPSACDQSYWRDVKSKPTLLLQSVIFSAGNHDFYIKNRYFLMFAINIDYVHVNDFPYFKGITYLPLLFHFVLFCLTSQ